ncbi:MAG: hypothetical protein KGD64_02980 [Candidatus Heimdallarchaeota archaeon]|nr:hypothetical protein [Candidatus Heimdallarchaeota archaeon]
MNPFSELCISKVTCSISAEEVEIRTAEVLELKHDGNPFTIPELNKSVLGLAA